MKKLILILLLLVSNLAKSQLISQHFSSTVPTGWLTTGTYLCVMNYDGTSTGNFRNVFDATKRSVRFPSASNGGNTFLYIPIDFVLGDNYNVIFYTKRACSVTLNTNETANQTTLLTTQTLSKLDCASNWDSWYEWNFVINSSYTGSGYIQINFPTVYGGPGSAYLDDFGVYEISTLPIELLYFEATENERYNHLIWSTASEDNNDYFNIEKTIDGVYYYNIARIDGAGNSNTQLYYEYDDLEMTNGICYYRLKQTDYDGRYKYHDMISVDNRIKIHILLRVINIYGTDVDIDTKGLLILIYEDGSIKKLYNN